jgi:hypothetical protein
MVRRSDQGDAPAFYSESIDDALSRDRTGGCEDARA